MSHILSEHLHKRYQHLYGKVVKLYAHPMKTSTQLVETSKQPIATYMKIIDLLVMSMERSPKPISSTLTLLSKKHLNFDKGLHFLSFIKEVEDESRRSKETQLIT